MNKRLIIGILSLSIIFSTATAKEIKAETCDTAADICSRIYAEYGDEVEVEIKDGCDITYEEVADIVEDNPDAGKITILETGGVEDEENVIATDYKEHIYTIDSWSPPIGSTHKYSTTKTVTTANYVAKDDFVISVAKGETMTLSRKYSGEISGSVSGSYFKFDNLGINMKISYEYSISHKFVGPAENSRYNSREFRVKYLQDKGTYVQTDTCYKPNGSLYGVRSKRGSYVEATKYVAYSKDKLV